MFETASMDSYDMDFIDDGEEVEGTGDRESLSEMVRV